MSGGVHLDGLTGEPTKPCQCHSIRLGLNVMPNEMPLFNTLSISHFIEHEGVLWFEALFTSKK